MTQWKEEQYQELSRKVAEKFNVAVVRVTYVFVVDYIMVETWLHEDWNQIMELCVNNNIFVEKLIFNHDNIHHKAFHCTKGFSGAVLSVKESDHHNDPSLAERVARMETLLAVPLCQNQ